MYDSSPPRYRYLWPVRQVKGRWQIKVQGYKSNTVTFKVDKRKQIVEVANSWDGAPKGSPGNGSLCDDFARYIYSYVGLGAGGGSTVTDLYNSMNTAKQDTGKGAIAFYHFPSDSNAQWKHNGVGVGGSIVDQNCPLPHNKVTDPPTIGLHSDQAAELLAPPAGTGLYSPPSYYSTQELQDIDSE